MWSFRRKQFSSEFFLCKFKTLIGSVSSVGRGETTTPSGGTTKYGEFFIHFYQQLTCTQFMDKENFTPKKLNEGHTNVQ